MKVWIVSDGYGLTGEFSVLKVFDSGPAAEAYCRSLPGFTDTNGRLEWKDGTINCCGDLRIESYEVDRGGPA